MERSSLTDRRWEDKNLSLSSLVPTHGQPYIESPSFQDSFLDGYADTHQKIHSKPNSEEINYQISQNFKSNDMNSYYFNEKNSAATQEIDYLPEDFFQRLKVADKNDKQTDLNKTSKQVDPIQYTVKRSDFFLLNQPEKQLYARASQQQTCQQLIQQEVSKELNLKHNAKKMCQHSYRIVARKLEEDIRSKMSQVDTNNTKIITFSQLGKLFQLLGLFTVTSFDQNSQRKFTSQNH